MSREKLADYQYLCAQNLWIKIDEWAHEIDMKSEDPVGQSSESYKMLLMGRREMLDALVQYLSENQETLEDIANNFDLSVKGV